MYRKNLKNEYYTRKAREDNYPARSVYKLQQIDEKFNLIKAGDKVFDLGCAPGSWLLYIAKKISDRGGVVGVDIQDLKIKIPQNAEFIKSDVMEYVPTSVGIPTMVGRKFDVIVSDLASNTSGEHFVDTERSLELGEKALEIAQNNLKSGGNFLCKILEGEGINDFFKKVETNFAFAKRYKPLASRKESREIYIIGKNFNG
jgi:23S rRNA (uridine2552-2'-O)-methyltransferase